MADPATDAFIQADDESDPDPELRTYFEEMAARDVPAKRNPAFDRVMQQREAEDAADSAPVSLAQELHDYSAAFERQQPTAPPVSTPIVIQVGGQETVMTVERDEATGKIVRVVKKGKE